MSGYKSDFLNILKSAASSTSAPISRASTRARRRGTVGYIGYDCTAPSLHIGNS